MTYLIAAAFVLSALPLLTLALHLQSKRNLEEEQKVIAAVRRLNDAFRLGERRDLNVRGN